MKNVSLFLLFLGFLLIPEYAFAQTSVESGLQWVLDLLTGTVATIVATIAVVIVGFSAMFGILDFRRAMGVVLGIVIVFGAAQIVTSLTG